MSLPQKTLDNIILHSEECGGKEFIKGKRAKNKVTCKKCGASLNQKKICREAA